MIKKQWKQLRNNKYARHNYSIQDTVEAGIVLQGHEVKSLKTTKWSLKDALVTFKNQELRLVNFTIPLYEKASHKQLQWYNPKQDRKLLVTQQQMARLYERTRKTWYMLLPLEMRENPQGRIKCLVWLWKLLKKVDKKQKIKDKDTKRIMDKQIKEYM